jgi:hypothetical protein
MMLNIYGLDFVGTAFANGIFLGEQRKTSNNISSRIARAATLYPAGLSVNSSISRPI